MLNKGDKTVLEDMNKQLATYSNELKNILEFYQSLYDYMSEEKQEGDIGEALIDLIDALEDVRGNVDSASVNIKIITK